MLDWTRISWRPQKGLNTYVDELSLGQEYASEMTDLFVDGGAAKKRLGWARSAQPTFVDDEIKSIFQAGDELCAITKKRLYGWNETSNDWVSRGRVPVGAGTLTPIVEDEGKSCASDVAYTTDEGGGKWYLELGQTLVQATTLGTLSLSRIVLHIKDGNGSTIQFDDTFASGSTAATTVFSPKAITLTNRKVIFAFCEGWNYGTSPTTASEIHFYSWNPDTPDTAPVNIGNITDMSKYDGPEWAPFDMCAIAGGEWMFSYVKTGTPNSVVVWNKDDTFTDVWATSSRGLAYFTDPYKLSIEYNDTNDEVMVTVADDAAGTWNWWYQTLSYGDTLPISVSAYSLDSWSTFEPYSMGISKLGTNENSAVRVVAALSRQDTSGAQPHTYYVSISPTAAGPFTGVVTTAYNTNITVNPWWKNSRCYMGLLSHQKYAGYNMPFVIDTGEGDVDTGEESMPFCMVAAWDFGAGPSIDISTSGTVEITTGFFQGASPKIYEDGEVVGYTSTSIGSLELDKARYEQNHVRLDYAFRPMATPSIRGGIVITGSVVAWYDGTKVVELGCPGTPNVQSDSQITGSIDATTVTSYQFYWRGPDANGVVHRGVPSKPHTVTRSGVDTEGYRLNVLRHSCTMRDIMNGSFKWITPLGFAAGSDASVGLNENYQRFTLPGRCEGNANSATVAIDDDGSGYGSVVYTTDGQDLESEFPPGCKFAANVRDRLWLLGQYRQDKALYSDRTSVGDLTADLYAPEFNAAFGFQAPNGERFTGATEVEDKAILFTDSGTYVVAGLGPDNAGRGNDYSGLVQLSDEYGCIYPHSVTETDAGTFFQSKQGLCLLSNGQNGMQLQFVPQPNMWFGEDWECLRGLYDPKRRQAYFYQRYIGSDDEDDVLLVLNLVEMCWSKWTSPATFNDICMYGGRLSGCATTGYIYYIRTDGLHLDSGTGGYNTVLETPWLKMGPTNSSHGNLRSIFITGTYTTTRDLEVSVYYDYIGTAAETITVSSADLQVALDGRVDLRVRPSRGRCSAVKVRVRDMAANPSQDGFDYQSIDFEIGTKRGTKKVRAEKKA